MIQLIKVLSLTLIFSLNISCVENKTSENERVENQLEINSNSDTLKFTSEIRSIFHDSKGNYWLGSHNEGVALFDGKSFQYFSKEDGLIDNQVRTIQEDKKGNIWFGTAKGVSMYDGKNITNFNTKTENPIEEWKNSNGDLWFTAGRNEGVNRFDGQKLNFLTFPTTTKVNPYNTLEVTGITTDKNDNVWIATYSALFKFDGNELHIFDHKKLNLNPGEELHIRSVFVDSQERTWIGNNGIGVLLLTGDSVTNFSLEQGLIHENSKKSGDLSPEGTLEHVFAIQEDKNGDIWFGDRDTGAWKFDGKTMKNYTINDKIASKMVWYIYVDRDGNLLFSIANGVYILNNQTFERLF
ncbi:ligand-binding sensor domain-containing protein [Brumimicrobium mesophilum]|uniref:ligand-binding sensor domain-containing protein n=1 Tax=Brumimicrobium mesophilum TaxID=392717 RepID=UPI000D141FF2|nr:two-component regulator propeller domain-containing protein [Brumimicrobium mesophilum]